MTEKGPIDAMRSYSSAERLRQADPSMALPPFLVLLLVLMPPNSGQPATAASVSHSPLAGNSRVTMSVYYETLCPFCANFIVNNLVKNVYEKGLFSIISLRMIPWGNAALNSDNTFLCQHGPDECMVNTIEACAITEYPQPEKHLGFIDCVERLTLEGKHQDWASCLSIVNSSLGGDASSSSAIMKCYSTGYGKQIELKFAEETAGLQPPHTYVPWVVVNDRPIREDFQNFASHVCKAYRGSAPLPEACSRSPPSNEPQETRAPSVCFAGQRKLK